MPTLVMLLSSEELIMQRPRESDVAEIGRFDYVEASGKASYGPGMGRGHVIMT